MKQNQNRNRKGEARNKIKILILDKKNNIRRMKRTTRIKILFKHFNDIIILKVVGAGGAIFGCSECFSVRDERNIDYWRFICTVISILVIIQICFGDKAKRLEDTSIPFTLEVLGGAGSVWGCSEILGLRTNYPKDCQTSTEMATALFSPGFSNCENTYPLWRSITIGFLCLFFIRFASLNRKTNTVAKKISGTVVDRNMFTDFNNKFCMVAKTTEQYISTFILEVMGGCGSCWAAAEVLYLRKGWSDANFGQPSFNWWRVYVMPVVFIFCLSMWIDKQKSTKPGKNRVICNGDTEEELVIDVLCTHVVGE